MSENEQGEKGVTELTDRVALEIIRTPLIKSILRQVINEIDPKSASRLTRTLLRKDSELTTTILENFPSLINAVTAAVNETLKSLQKMPAGTISASIPAGIRGIDAREIGETVNSLTQLLNSLHKENPTPLADPLSELLVEVTATIDVGALCEAMEGSAGESVVIVNKLMDKILEDPIKAGGLILAIVPVVNAITKSLADSISKVNALPSEVMPVTVSAVAEALDTEAVGELVNSVAQFINGLNREDPELLPRILPDMLSSIDYKAITEFFCPATGLTAALIKSVDGKKLGEAISSRLQAINTAHKENPTLLTDTFSPFITNLISSTDFGELGEAIEGSSEDILAMAKASNEILWTNLGKVISMGAVLPAIINLIVKSLKETLPQIEEVTGDVLPIGDFAPEVVDEMVSSMPLIKDVDAREIGELINSLLGIMRGLLHTLGILLGKEAPMTRELISQKLRDTLSTIDPEKFAEATVALSEAGEGITNTVTDVLMENPEFMFSVISTTPAVVNSLVRSSNRAISRIAEIPPDLLGAVLSEAVAGIDTKEVSELLNSLIRTINGIHETNPKLLTDPLSRIISGVDSGEARKLGNYLMEDLRVLLGQA